MLWFWHVKNAEVEKKWDDIDDQRDSYDRQDNYNVIGLAVYMFMANKSALNGISGQGSCEFGFIKSNNYQSPISNDFMFESL